MRDRSGSPLKNKRVLIVEETPTIALRLDAALAQAGAQVVAIRRKPAEAVKIARLRAPDLVLMTYAPDAADAVITAVRQITQEDEACLVLMAAHVLEKEEQELLQAGAAAIIAEPFSTEQVLPVLEETYRAYCERRGAS